MVKVGDEPVEFMLLVSGERFRRYGLRVWVRVREGERVRGHGIVARWRRERVFECRHGEVSCARIGVRVRELYFVESSVVPRVGCAYIAGKL